MMTKRSGSDGEGRRRDIVPGNAAWFGGYELGVYLLTPKGGSKSEVHPAGLAAAGALGGMSYWFFPFPFDVVKSKIQTGKCFFPLVGLSYTTARLVSSFFVVPDDGDRDTWTSGWIQSQRHHSSLARVEIRRNRRSLPRLWPHSGQGCSLQRLSLCRVRDDNETVARPADAGRQWAMIRVKDA
eukprot:765564-Hanusia_phi.AAC.2